MTVVEKVKTVQALVGGDTQATLELVSVYLDDAKEAILNRRYPFGFDSSKDVPSQYERLQCRLAARYFLRRGAEGEDSHSEDGADRSYGSVNDEDLLMEVVQVLKVN